MLHALAQDEQGCGRLAIRRNLAHGARMAQRSRSQPLKKRLHIVTRQTRALCVQARQAAQSRLGGEQFTAIGMPKTACHQCIFHDLDGVLHLGGRGRRVTKDGADQMAQSDLNDDFLATLRRQRDVPRMKSEVGRVDEAHVGLCEAGCRPLGRLNLNESILHETRLHGLAVSVERYALFRRTIDRPKAPPARRPDHRTQATGIREIRVRISAQSKAIQDKEKRHTRATFLVWRCLEWWSWGDLNPRPSAVLAQIYMFSGLFWISPMPSRSRTL